MKRENAGNDVSSRDFQEFTQIVKAQNETMSKIHSDQIAQNETISRIQLEQNAATTASIDGMAKSIDKLAEVQVILTQAHIEAKKDREHDQKRIERVEENQKEHGQEVRQNKKDQDLEVKHISETLILLEERTGNATRRWATIVTTVSAAIAAVIAAYFIGKK